MFAAHVIVTIAAEPSAAEAGPAVRGLDVIGMWAGPIMARTAARSSTLICAATWLARTGNAVSWQADPP
jgi:hypothetical protein